MRNLLFLFFLLSRIISVSAQSDPLDTKMKLFDQKRPYSWAYRNVFLDCRFSCFAEYMIYPAIEYTFLDTWNPSASPVYQNYTDKGILFSIATVALEPRINLVSNDRNAIDLKFPVSCGLSISTEGDKYNNLKSAGVFHFTAPVLVGYAHGLNATYSNTERFGFSISGGVQYMKAPMAGAKLHQHYAENYVGTPAYKLRKKWLFPLVQLEFFRLNKEHKIRGYSFAFSLAKPTYFNFMLTYVLTKK
jgi:hypothetical protein